MKIYVVTSGEYSGYEGYEIRAVFTDEGKANVYCAEHYEDDDPPVIEVWETSDDKIESDVDTIWEYKMLWQNEKLHNPHSCRCLVKREDGRYNNRVEIECHSLIVYVYLKEFDEMKACKIGHDVYAKYKAEIAGIS